MATLLINWVYYRAVGHIIEALGVARSFAAANDGLRISLLVNSASAPELALCDPSVEAVFTVDLPAAGEAPAFPAIPRDWDFVFHDPRSGIPTGHEGLDRFHAALREWIRAGATNLRNPDAMPSRKAVPVRLSLPQEVRAAAALRMPDANRSRISILPGSGNQPNGPSPAFWEMFLTRFFDRHPDGEVVLLGSFEPRRTITRGVTPEDVSRLAGMFPRLINAVDAGLLNQLALAERCDVHVSPHTGMSFAVQAVGVQWLVLSGQKWHEFLLNGVPILAIAPACPLYPCFRGAYPECDERFARGERTLCVEDATLLGRMEEIIDGLELLLDGGLTYRESALRHEKMLRERLGPESWTIVDWPAVVAEDYVY